MMMLSYYGVCQECGWVRFLAVYFPHKTNPTPRKIYMLWEKVALNATFNLFFLGLGWPWVGEFDDFTITCMFPNPTEFGISQNNVLCGYHGCFRAVSRPIMIGQKMPTYDWPKYAYIILLCFFSLYVCFQFLSSRFLSPSFSPPCLARRNE